MMRDTLHLYKSGMGFTDTLKNLATEKINKNKIIVQKKQTLYPTCPLPTAASLVYQTSRTK